MRTSDGENGSRNVAHVMGAGAEVGNEAGGCAQRDLRRRVWGVAHRVGVVSLRRAVAWGLAGALSLRQFWFGRSIRLAYRGLTARRREAPELPRTTE